MKIHEITLQEDVAFDQVLCNTARTDDRFDQSSDSGSSRIRGRPAISKLLSNEAIISCESTISRLERSESQKSKIELAIEQLQLGADEIQDLKKAFLFAEPKVGVTRSDSQRSKIEQAIEQLNLGENEKLDLKKTFSVSETRSNVSAALGQAQYRQRRLTKTFAEISAIKDEMQREEMRRKKQKILKQAQGRTVQTDPPPKLEKRVSKADLGPTARPAHYPYGYAPYPYPYPQYYPHPAYYQHSPYPIPMPKVRTALEVGLIHFKVIESDRFWEVLVFAPQFDSGSLKAHLIHHPDPRMATTNIPRFANAVLLNGSKSTLSRNPDGTLFKKLLKNQKVAELGNKSPPGEMTTYWLSPGHMKVKIRKH